MNLLSNPSDSELEKIREKKLNELKKKMTVSPSNMPQGVLQLSNIDFDQTIQEGVTLVDFFATWCGPFKMMAPVVDKLAQEFAGKAKVAKVDVDLNMDIAMRYRVQGVPTFGIFKDGQLVQRIVGGVGYQPLKAALSQLL